MEAEYILPQVIQNMDNHELTELHEQLEHLNFVQLKRTRQRIEELISANQVGKPLLNVKMSSQFALTAIALSSQSTGRLGVVNNATNVSVVNGHLTP